jgi:hypothetical protein
MAPTTVSLVLLRNECFERGLILALVLEEWYRARLTYANSNNLAWDVEYDDGDEANELCHDCVRPFVPYSLNEFLDVRVSPTTYAPGQVRAIHRLDGTFDIRLNKDGQILSRVRTKDLRRRGRSGRMKFTTARLSSSEQHQIPVTVGMRVMAGLPELDSDELFPGKITKANSDGTFAVMFDDGDFAPFVRRSLIDVL